MNTKLFRFFYFTAIISMLATTGCSTLSGSSLDARKKERYSAYQALPVDIRQAVDTGTLKAGMNTDAVYIAWGSPSEMISGGNASGEYVTWIYKAQYIQQVESFGYRLRTEYINSSYVRAQAIFAGGVLKEWQSFPHP